MNWCEIRDNQIYAYSQEEGTYRAALSDNLLDEADGARWGAYTAPPKRGQERTDEAGKQLAARWSEV